MRAKVAARVAMTRYLALGTPATEQPTQHHASRLCVGSTHPLAQEVGYSFTQRKPQKPDMLPKRHRKPPRRQKKASHVCKSHVGPAPKTSDSGLTRTAR